MHLRVLSVLHNAREEEERKLTLTGIIMGKVVTSVTLGETLSSSLSGV